MQEISERVAKAEQRLDNHDARLDRHGQQIDSLKLNDVRLESKIDRICKEVVETKTDVAENTELTRSIKDGIKTIKWIGSAAIGAYAVYEVLVKMGWL